MEDSKNNEKTKKTVRVILNVPESLNLTFADLAEKRGLPKSAMIIYAMSWFLDYNKSMDLMPKMIDFVSKTPEELEKDLKGLKSLEEFKQLKGFGDFEIGN